MELCGGPGHKRVFATKAEAQSWLERPGYGRRARVGKGKVYSCPWALGAHYHITSGRRRK